MTGTSPAAIDLETAFDGTPLRHPTRPRSRYRPLAAVRHFRELLKDKENTAEVFRIYDALPSRQFVPRVRALTLSPHGDALRRSEPFLPPILDDHDALRKTPAGSVAHAYCDFMESEGLSAAGLVAEFEKAGRPVYDDLVQWFGFRQRDTHDLMHVLTGYGRDALGEQLGQAVVSLEREMHVLVKRLAPGDAAWALRVERGLRVDESHVAGSRLAKRLGDRVQLERHRGEWVVASRPHGNGLPRGLPCPLGRSG